MSEQWTLRNGIFRTRRALQRTVKSVVRVTGYDVIPYYKERAYPVDFTAEHISILKKVTAYTLTPPERVYAMAEAVRYVVQQNIPGSIVECGVWRGGSMMTAALVLNEMGRSDRDLHLFDTFEGMPKPEAMDVDYDGNPAMATFLSQRSGDDTSWSCYATLPDVQQAMTSTGYDTERVHFIKGKVEQTIPDQAPDPIALLRLDTDWYASTRHELEHLYPRLAPGGILIIDDYGHWQGARKATDEYLAEHAPWLFLNRIDFSARIAQKALARVPEDSGYPTCFAP